MNKNYFDESGNLVNVENKSLAAIYMDGAKQNNWIKCSDQLPNENVMVIICIYGSDMIMPIHGETLTEAIERDRKSASVTVGFIGSDGWYGADWCPLMVKPTYWMPLPQAPEPPESEVQNEPQ